MQWPRLQEIFDSYFYADGDFPSVDELAERVRSDLSEVDRKSLADELTTFLAQEGGDLNAQFESQIRSYFSPTEDGNSARSWLTTLHKELG